MHSHECCLATALGTNTSRVLSNILRYWQDAPVYTVQYNLLRVESVIMADATASFKDVPELFEVGIDLTSHGQKGLMVSGRTWRGLDSED